MNQSQRPFLGYVHSFRGFAILNVVMIHCVGLSLSVANHFIPDPGNPLVIINETLFHGSTIYFALISGLLFSSILCPRGYVKFYRGKLLNVVMPYLVFTALFTMINPPGPEGIFVLRGNWQTYAPDVFNNFVFGQAQFTYWYIPVLFILFALTPALRFITSDARLGNTALMLVLAAPLLFSRTATHLSFSTLVYFVGAYTAGVFLGQDIERKLAWISARWRWFVSVALLTSLAIVYMQCDGFEFIGPVSVLESCYYIQKLALSALMLVWLRSMAENQPRWLAGFANSAFSIYFLHMIFIVLAIGLVYPLLLATGYYEFNILAGAFGALLFSLGFSAIIIHAARLVFGKYSRIMVGS
jgi:surface polysaccharide O-acyltransferase-like enzyme